MKEPTEYDEQVAFVEYLALMKKKNKIVTFFATNNENNSHKQNRKYAMIAEVKARKSGKQKGVSDICVVLKNKVVFIELKRQPRVLKNGTFSKTRAKPTPEQIEFLDGINESDACVGSVCWGAKEAIKFLEKNM